MSELCRHIVMARDKGDEGHIGDNFDMVDVAMECGG